MKKAKLFNSDGGQAVLLPNEYRFDGDEVLIEKTDHAIILSSAEHPWEPLLNSLDKFSDDFMDTREQH